MVALKVCQYASKDVKCHAIQLRSSNITIDCFEIAYLKQALTRLSDSSRSRPIPWSRSRTRSRFRDILSPGIGLGLGLEAWAFLGAL